MACVGNDDDLRAIAIGTNGAFTAMKAGAIFVDHTTASAEVARELVARFSQIEGYKCLSLTRALDVVKCQLALA